MWQHCVNKHLWVQCEFGVFQMYTFLCVLIFRQRFKKKKETKKTWICLSHNTRLSLRHSAASVLCFLQRGNTLKALSATRPKTNPKKDQIGKMSVHEKSKKKKNRGKRWGWFLNPGCIFFLWLFYLFHVSVSPFVSTFLNDVLTCFLILRRM